MDAKAATSASYDESEKESAVLVDRDSEEVVLKPKQLIMASDMSGKVIVPQFEGMDRFKGDQNHLSKSPGQMPIKAKKAVMLLSLPYGRLTQMPPWYNAPPRTFCTLTR